MPRPIINEKGNRYGRHIVLGFAETRHNGIAYWLCRCDCGKETTVQGSMLRNGKSMSCGCLVGDTQRSHGMDGTKIYIVWSSMKARCQNPKSKAWKNYGGRGITVCERWQKFENFYADMGEPPIDPTVKVGSKRTHMSLDRINNNGNYEPSNCRWATWSDQNKNQRRYLAADVDSPLPKPPPL